MSARTGPTRMGKVVPLGTTTRVPGGWVGYVLDASGFAVEVFVPGDDAARCYRVHAYDHEHHATLIVEAASPERAGAIACEFVASMQLGYYPADHERRWPEIVRIETATSSFEADEEFASIVESIEEVDPEALGRA